MSATSLEQLVSLCKQRGFIFPGSEIYGGLANTWDYGPLGVELKNRVKQLWWNTFVRKRHDMVGLDASILMNPKVWEASGHVSSFSDPLVDCKKCKQRFRGDKLIEERISISYPELLVHVINLVQTGQFDMGGPTVWFKLGEKFHEAQTPQIMIWDQKKEEYVKPKNFVMEALPILLKYNMHVLSNGLKNIGIDIGLRGSEKTMNGPILCPNCGGHDWSEPRQFNLMFKTKQGVIEGEGADIYLRPETAQGIFVNFKNVAQTMRLRLPFGVAQIGKAFRNEITPGNFTFRTREFEQMEIEYFFDAERQPWEDVFAEWKKSSWSFLVDTLGIREENLRLRDHEPDELSHYSKGTTDIEYKFPWGWGELCAAAAYRGDFDLTQHQTFSGEDLSYSDPDDPKRKILPHVMEPSFGADRVTLAVLLDAYSEEAVAEDTRTVMKFHPSVAPVDVAILPLSKKEHLIGKAEELYKKIVQESNLHVDFDITGSIGKRYRRQDEIGTPKCITVDFGTLGEDAAQGEKDTVTIRDRDTLEQIRVPLENVLAELSR